MKKQLLVNLAKYGLGFSLLAYVIGTNWAPKDGVGISNLLHRQPQVTPLLLATVIYLGGVLLTFVRWYVLVRAQHLPFTLTNAVRLGLMGFALSTFLPGSIGGDVFKAYFLAREQSRRTVAVATVLLDRAVGLWGLFWLVALVGGGFWLGGDPALQNRWLRLIVSGAVAVVVGSVVLWLLLGVLPQWRAERFAGRLSRLPKVGGMAAEFWRAVWMYRCQGRSVALALLMALVGHVGFVLTFYFAARTFLVPGQDGQVPSFAEHFVLIPIGMIVQALVPLPGGIGVAELSFGGLYALAGKPNANGVCAALVARVVAWALAFVGYLIYLRLRPQVSAAAEGAESAMRQAPGLVPAG